MNTVETLKTGITRINGRRLFFASLRGIQAVGNTKEEAILNLEEKLNAVSDHPIYLSNFNQ